MCIVAEAPRFCDETDEEATRPVPTGTASAGGAATASAAPQPPSSRLVAGISAGYVMGKAEGKGDRWHGHVTAVTVAPEHRRGGLAAALMARLEAASELRSARFVDLFVRASNAPARAFYGRRRYREYRRVIDYYQPDPRIAGDRGEDAWDLRLPLSTDPTGASAEPLGRAVGVDELEWD